MAIAPAVVLPRRVINRARAQNPFSTVPSGDTVSRDDAIDLNRSIRETRRSASAAAAMRTFFETNDILSTAVANFVAMASTPYKIKTYSTATQEYDRAGTLTAEAILSGLATDWDYAQGYSDKRSLNGLIETLLLEVVLTGGVGVELVLDKSRLPTNLNIFPYDSITWVSKGNGRKVPTQKGSDGNVIDLNLPTIWVGESMNPANRKYALPLLHAGLKRVVGYEQFLEDAWRVITKAGLSRLVVKLNYDKVVQSAPVEIRNDATKLSNYLEEVRSVHEQVLAGIAPEEALVTYDLAEVNALKVNGEKAEISDLISQLSGLAASALKSNPSMLGLRIGGSQNTSSTEALLATKTAALFQKPVAEVLSRALTLACRLYGADVYVEFSFDDIDLRPQNELEAHLQIKQARVLQLLSLGRVNDDEAQSMLGLGSLPAGAEELAGTRFLDKVVGDTVPVAATNSRNRQISPETPTSSGGADNQQRP